MLHPTVKSKIEHDEFLRTYWGPERDVLFHLPKGRNINICYRIQQATTLIERAFAAGVLREGRELLIFGAGATGIAAALAAMHRGVAVTIKDRVGLPFHLQAGCTTRYLHPHMHRWPETGWKDVRFNDPNISEVLHWRAGKSHLIAREWRAKWDRATRRAIPRPHLELDPHLGKLPPRNFIEFQQQYDPQHRYAMYLSVLGFSEVINLKDCAYRGYAFWQSDPFEKTVWSSLSTSPAVFISGGGDGALQDCLRIALKGNTKDLMRKIEAGIRAEGRNGASAREWKEFEGRVKEIEESLARWFEEYPEAASDEVQESYRRAHEDYQLLLSQFSTELWQLIRNVLDAHVLFPFDKGKLHLAHQRPYLGKSYPLNRVLVCMLNRYVEEADVNHGPVLLPSTEVRRISGQLPHQCSGQPDGCFNQGHNLELDTPAGPQSAQYQIVVIRHGIKDTPVIRPQA